MKRPGGLAHRFVQYSGRLWIPAIVLGELYAGAYLLDTPDPILAGIQELRRDVGLVDFDAASTEEFGRLRGWLKRHGSPRNPVDLMIAAVALARGLCLVTHNTRHFQDLPDLRLEDWLTP